MLGMAKEPDILLDMPDQPVLERALVEYAHTGRAVFARPDILEDILSSLAAGVSQRSIARRHGVGRETIRVAARELARLGKLGPAKERLAARLLGCAEMGAETLAERLEDDALPPTALPIAIGVAIDKYLLLTGGPTQICEQKSRAPTREEIAEWMRGLPDVTASLPDVTAPRAAEGLPGATIEIRARTRACTRVRARESESGAQAAQDVAAEGLPPPTDGADATEDADAPPVSAAAILLHADAAAAAGGGARAVNNK